VLDPRQRFLNSTGDHYIVAVGGVSLYRDSEHLTGTGAKLLLLPFFRDSVMAQTLVQ